MLRVAAKSSHPRGGDLRLGLFPGHRLAPLLLLFLFLFTLPSFEPVTAFHAFLAAALSSLFPAAFFIILALRI